MSRASRGAISKVVLPAAGLGTRLLPITKELPKEMLPIFVRANSGRLCPKPILQAVFEQLHDAGFRDFCFVVGREKRAIEDHFTPDAGNLRKLSSKGNRNRPEDLKNFYRKVRNSNIVWINQLEPRGFGDAVLRAEPFVGGDRFLCHAGDTYIVSKGNRHFAELFSLSDEEKCGAVFVAQRVKNPEGYGILEGERISDRVYGVRRVVEKPKRPKSNIAIMPLYVFRPVIFQALRKTGRGFGGEFQLTDAIQRLIDWKSRVYAYLLDSDDMRFDIGTPETWWEALALSHSHC
jgi:UTP--glucose-1-phosphate uridylyltransferase